MREREKERDVLSNKRGAAMISLQPWSHFYLIYVEIHKNTRWGPIPAVFEGGDVAASIISFRVETNTPSLFVLRWTAFQKLHCPLSVKTARRTALAIDIS